MASWLPLIDAGYRTEVLWLDGDDTEDRLDERLVAAASELGLRVPYIQIAASLAASINAGCLDIVSSSSSLSSTPTLSLNNINSPVRSSGASVELLAGSFSDTTLSDHGHSDSIPSIDSFSTCQTSISSFDARASLHNERHPRVGHSSQSSIARSAERKRTSFINAIGKSFRRRRTPSGITLPPDAQISLRREGVTSTVLVETRSVMPAPTAVEPPAVEEKLHVEVPVFDEAAVQRSLENEQLKDMLDKHKAQRSRFVHLQNGLLDTLKEKHLAIIAERITANKQEEAEKQKQNSAHTARMEERHLVIEIDQIKEFDKAKRNLQTRIKHMEGYFQTSSPPQSPKLGSELSLDLTRSARTVTRRQKEQLAQEYLDRESMDQLHEARIKVLRERQERQLQETSARLEKELENLIAKNADTIADLERDHQSEEQELLQVFDTKKARLRWRWNIEEAILRKQLQDRDAKPYGPLPTISFSSPSDDLPVLRNPFANP
ncbi:hypothetical protein BGW36DRAFT_306128 [Talaromyces proteolyticus]|uniref:Uncharacterized protein n=1 Tax=Talaromyces proteolyticus TaxID=1131652 RepID=A0AAD4KFM3_9EURO|nr:uncharacterized protein BGW36DRAFT_306128 [Talaromyces proteolyticus]KAH8690566.1 hypothetical protein BGW36DRAFT_306128 [Talaromyces proteolyticus]